MHKFKLSLYETVYAMDNLQMVSPQINHQRTRKSANFLWTGRSESGRRQMTIVYYILEKVRAGFVGKIRHDLLWTRIGRVTS